MAALYMVLVHCPKNILNLGIETEPVTVGADATIYVWFMGQISGPKNRTYAFESAPAVTGSVFMRRIRLVLAQCGRCFARRFLFYIFNWRHKIGGFLFI